MATVPTTPAPTRMTAAERANQRNAVLAGFLGWTLDAFDFFILTLVIEDVAKSFGRSRPEIALALTVALATRPIGAVVFGIMADHWGRRLPLMINIVFYAVISVLSGLAPSYQVFMLLRMLFGIGMGGEWGVGASLALESASPRLRGLLSGLLQEGYAIGNLLSALAFRAVYPLFNSLYPGNGWRLMFFLGGLPALLSLFIRAKVKESAAWHEHRTDWVTYRRSLMGIGGLVFGFWSDRIGRRRAMMTAMAFGLSVIPFWIAGHSPSRILIGVFFMQFFVQGAWGVIPAHINELAPGHLRGFMPGVAYQLGILCASSIPYIEALLGERFTYTQAMGSLMTLVFIGGFVVTLLGPEARGVSFRKHVA